MHSDFTKVPESRPKVSRPTGCPYICRCIHIFLFICTYIYIYIYIYILIYTCCIHVVVGLTCMFRFFHTLYVRFVLATRKTAERSHTGTILSFHTGIHNISPSLPYTYVDIHICIYIYIYVSSDILHYDTIHTHRYTIGRRTYSCWSN